MSDLSTFLTTEGLTTNEQNVEWCEQQSLETCASLVMLSQTDETAYGRTSGFELMARKQGITIEDMGELEAALDRHPWARDAIHKAAKRDYGIRLEPVETLPFISHDGHDFAHALIDADLYVYLEGHGTDDDTYDLVSVETLEEVREELGFKSTEYVPNEEDCDDQATHVNSLLKKIKGVNIPAGRSGISAIQRANGRPINHRLGIGLFVEGWYWIENDWRFYPLDFHPLFRDIRVKWLRI